MSRFIPLNYFSSRVHFLGGNFSQLFISPSLKRLCKPTQNQWTNINSLLTIDSHVVVDEPWRRRAYLNFNNESRKKRSMSKQQFFSLPYRLIPHTWHSYVASSIFCADSIFRRQLFGYWKSTEYLGSPEYVCFPTVRSSRPFSPLFRRTHET